MQHTLSDNDKISYRQNRSYNRQQYSVASIELNKHECKDENHLNCTLCIEQCTCRRQWGLFIGSERKIGRPDLCRPSLYSDSRSRAFMRLMHGKVFHELRHCSTVCIVSACIQNNVLMRSGLLSHVGICREGGKLRKIILIESNAKCRYLKKWPVKRLCGRCFYLSEVPPPLLWPHTFPPPFYTVYVYTVYTAYLFTQGKGEGEDS
jgi:hypothetical protein